MKKTAILTLLVSALSWVPLSDLRAEEVSGSVAQRLESIARDQKLILESLEQIKSELQIIKVRATNR